MSNRVAKQNVQLGIRVSKDLHDRIREAAANATPYTLNVSQIVIRGIELALKEIEQKQPQSRR
jgi:hypothetical protein